MIGVDHLGALTLAIIFLRSQGHFRIFNYNRRISSHLTGLVTAESLGRVVFSPCKSPVICSPVPAHSL